MADLADLLEPDDIQVDLKVVQDLIRIAIDEGEDKLSVVKTIRDLYHVPLGVANKLVNKSLDEDLP